ncbi:MAG TPA: imidazole glycerol phosphate synthase subunit HisH [Syntrophobacteria bacterium]|nr:imidazole glycerol phosphate synthase subunit HisH [Syntrophobacteria bacterium]
MIAVIDYRAGNLASVARALDYLGQPWVITKDAEVVRRAERVIFPGVGAAGAAMANLRESNLDTVIREAYASGRPFLGICLGTQVILDYSEEDDTPCLGIIRGTTRQFPRPLRDRDGHALKIPHMGWNRVLFGKERHLLMAGIEPESEFYFVHSFYPDPADAEMVQGRTEYGISFPALLACGHLAAVQFHPEKSGKPGLKLLENFCRWRW